MNAHMPPQPATRSRRLWAGAVIVGLACVLSAVLASVRFADHDMFHEMVLARAYFETGDFPHDDVAAFTPTHSPSVHHEWATGFVLHAFWKLGGLHAIAALRLILLAGVLAFAAATARRRGASWLLIAIMAPLGFLFLATGLSPVRAQLFTMLFLAIQLLMMDLDREGKRWWVPAWLGMHVLWLNLHGGFVVGPGLLAFHWIERVLRTRTPQWHLIVAGALSVPLMLINPWGFEYVHFLWDAITMPRPNISEWAPTWTAPLEMAVTAFAGLVILYAVLRQGAKNLPNLTLVVIVFIQALLHLRHLSLLGVVWLAYVPGFLAHTPLSAVLARIWERRAWLVGSVFAAAAAASVLVTAAPPWRVELGTGEQEGAPMPLPVLATDYLERSGFTGNVLTPFNGSAYLSWKLWPRVQISLDSRYEVAFPNHVVDDLRAFYAGKDSWRDTLDRYKPDAVLAPAKSRVNELLPQAGFRRVHDDAGFVLYMPQPTR